MSSEEFIEYLSDKPTIKGIVKEMKTWWWSDSEDDSIIQLGFDKILQLSGEEKQMKEKGYIRLIKDFDVDTSCDGELWVSKEDDDQGFSLKIDIEYSPLSVNFYKQKGFEFKNSFRVSSDVIKAVNERLEEITGEVE